MRKKGSKKRKTIETNAAALRLLRSPQFLFNVGKQIGVGGVVGEYQSRLVLYLACLTSALQKVVSVLIKGPTSTGKNNLLKGVLSLIPPELVLTRSSFSKKALAYGVDDLAGRILYLVEHRGGRDAQFYMRLLQSEGALQHEATNISGGKRETDVAIRPGAPVFLSTTTDERIFEDDETRFLSLRADESSELTREVLRVQFRENREEDENTERQLEKGSKRQIPLSDWHDAFRILRTNVPRFRYPGFFDYLAEHVPAGNSRARRDAPRFLSFLQAVALCQGFSDGRRKKAEKEIEINFADYCVAFAICSGAFTSTYVGAHPMALEFAKAVRHLCGKSNKPVTTKDVQAHLKWKNQVAHKWRVAAVRQKLVQYKPGTHPNNKKPLLPGPAKHATTFLPDPRLVLRERPEIGNVVRYVDPITGQEKVLRRQTEEDDET